LRREGEEVKGNPRLFVGGGGGGKSPLYVYQCKASSNELAVLCFMLLYLHQVL